MDKEETEVEEERSGFTKPTLFLFLLARYPSPTQSSSWNKKQGGLTHELRALTLFSLSKFCRLWRWKVTGARGLSDY
jgi:hypothetical protein